MVRLRNGNQGAFTSIFHFPASCSSGHFAMFLVKCNWLKGGGPSAGIEPPKKARTMVHVARIGPQGKKAHHPSHPCEGQLWQRGKITPNEPLHTKKDLRKGGERERPNKAYNPKMVKNVNNARSDEEFACTSRSALHYKGKEAIPHKQKIQRERGSPQ